MTKEAKETLLRKLVNHQLDVGLIMINGVGEAIIGDVPLLPIIQTIGSSLVGVESFELLILDGIDKGLYNETDIDAIFGSYIDSEAKEQLSLLIKGRQNVQ